MGRHVHFIGIGGSGLSAIATVIMERGDSVSGSDRQASSVTHRLEDLGMTIYIGHRPENITGADLVIRSSAIRDENVEVLAARKLGIPVFKRADFLAYLTGYQRPIAISGTHGKTTTTALVTWLLHEQGMDPSYVIGGVSINLGKNAHAAEGDYFVIEADEYDRMFLGLKPYIAIVTNVEHDHPDYFPTPEDFHKAFEEFIDKLARDGALISNLDDAGAAMLLPRAASAGIRSFSFSLRARKADYFASELHLGLNGGFVFDLFVGGKPAVKQIRLQLPGLHNVSNALAALAVADVLGLNLEKAAQACMTFEGAGRRFELRGVASGVTIVDDYAHHPTEIRATLAAARNRYPRQQIWAVWQPHTFSRTRVLLDEFSSAFKDADKVLVTEIFASREQPPADGFSGSQVARSISKSKKHDVETVFFEPTFASAVEHLAAAVQPGDVVLVLSAGDADQISAQLLIELAKTNKTVGRN